MAGIRVRNIPKYVVEKELVIHFSKPTNGGGRIDKIYYPVSNNEAVILYEHRRAIEEVLKHNHQLHSPKAGLVELEVQPLPEHKVFTMIDARLDPESSVLVSVTPSLREEILYTMNIGLIQESDQSYRLQGNWYQIEWAWHYIDCFMQQQEVIHGMSQQPQRYATMETERDENSPYSSPLPADPELHRATKVDGAYSETSLQKRDERRRREESDLQNRGEGNGFQSRNGELHESLSIPVHERKNDTLAERSLSHSDARGRDYLSSAYQDDQESLYLQGKGFSIPQDSLQSTMDHSRRSKRFENENETFNKFSDLSLDLSTHSSQKESRREGERRPEGEQHDIDTSLQSHSFSSSLGSLKGHSALGEKAHRSSFDDMHKSSRQTESQFPARLTRIPSHYTEEQLLCTFDIHGLKVTVYYGDLIKEETEGIVNAANESLEHYGGIAYALKRARGPEMEEECSKYIRTHGNLKATEVIHTSGGGDLKCKCILHAAGPMWLSDFRRESFILQLTQTFLNCLNYAEEMVKIRTLALPALSTGVYSAPLDVSVRCFLDAILIFTFHHGSNRRLADVRLVNNDAESTVTSIVLIETLISSKGIDTLTPIALDLIAKASEKEKDMGLPRGRQERVSNFSKTYTSKMSAGLGYELASSGHRRTDLDDISSKSKRRSQSASRISTKKSENTRSQGAEYKTFDKHEADLVPSGSLLPSTLTGSSNRGQSDSFDYKSKREFKPDSNDKISSKTELKWKEVQSETSSRHLSPTESKTKTMPRVKRSLLDTDKLKTMASGSRSKTDTYGAHTKYDHKSFTHRGKKVSTPTRTPTDTSEDDEYEFGMHSLPANLHSSSSRDSHSYREKFLQTSGEKPEVCAICLDDVKIPKQLACKHKFCRTCIEKHFRSSKPSCPVCGTLFGKLVGDQPEDGLMTHETIRSECLPGYEHEDGIIIIKYTFPSGIQKKNHPHPGRYYKGIERKAYLPNSLEGREVLRMLKKAFQNRLVFTIGDSKTSGREDVLTWNDIHHKTSITGGSTKFGYPDPGYLQRVKDELAAKGITSDNL